MAHYYTNNKDLKSEIRIIQFDYQGKNLEFLSDIGVFSKNSIDYGSRVLLSTFDKLENVSLLDVGCGYGPLALSLASVGSNLACTLVDVNDRAIELATKNAKRLKLENVRVFNSSCYENVEGEFDVIISNPPIRAGKQIVHEILSGAYDHLKSNGYLKVVIQKKQGAPSAQKKMQEVFGNCEVIKKEKGYYILQSVKK